MAPRAAEPEERTAEPAPAALDLKTRAAGLAAWLLVHFLYGTTRKRVVGAERAMDLWASGRPIVFATWHGTLTVCAYQIRRLPVTALVSPSRDGDFLTALFRLFGWVIHRGSAVRGGVSGSLGIAREMRQGRALAWVADGPRGPAEELKPGLLRLAAIADAVIIPMGASARPAGRLRTWDRHLIPWPFARACIVFGEPIELPRRMSDAELERIARIVEDGLNEARRLAQELLDR
jgi:lysophospholipid acyltransferase (LPLAT)-like uncharacterized protein